MATSRDRFEQLGQSMLHAGFGLFFFSLVALVSLSFSGDLPQLAMAWTERLPGLTLLLQLAGPILVAQWAASCFLMVGALTFLKGDPRGHRLLVRLTYLAGLWIVGALVMGLSLIVPPGMAALRTILVTGRADETMILMMAGSLLCVVFLTAVLWDWSGRLVDLGRRLTAPEILAQLNSGAPREPSAPVQTGSDTAPPEPEPRPSAPARRPERSGDVDEFF